MTDKYKSQFDASCKWIEGNCECGKKLMYPQVAGNPVDPKLIRCNACKARDELIDEYTNAVYALGEGVPLHVWRDTFREFADRLTPVKPLEWKRGTYISKAKSIDNVWFTVQDGGKYNCWMLSYFIERDVFKTVHGSREEAEQTAETIHAERVRGYLLPG